MQNKLPLCQAVDATPAQRPANVMLEGRLCRVEKLDTAHHAPDLWRLIEGHDLLWAYLKTGPYSDERTFTAWIQEREDATDPFSYAILDKNGRAVGLAALMEIRPEDRVIEIGHILYSPALQRTPRATEAQYLFMHYVFETLGHRRYEWKCNALNTASHRAAERLGFTYEGVFRQHMIVKGRNRDTAWYSILDSEWPLYKVAFERWLSPENFTPDGKQKRRLEDFRLSEV